MDSGVCLYFKNEANNQSYKVDLNFSTMGNLKLRRCLEDERTTSFTLSKGGAAAVFLDPVLPGEDTKFKRPKIKTSAIDADGNGTFDKQECWKFIKENLANQVNKANYD